MNKTKTFSMYEFMSRMNIKAIIKCACFAMVLVFQYGCMNTQQKEDVEKTVYNSHEYVDLGLPSGTKWATCNVGASLPEEYGDYYAWGETETKEIYDWVTYKWCYGSDDTMTKYGIKRDEYGKADDRMVLYPEDDVAQIKWGGKWRMPTVWDWDELVKNCTWKWKKKNGIRGYKITSKTNGNSIFLPATGIMSSSKYTIEQNLNIGNYWTSFIDIDPSGDSECASYFDFDEKTGKKIDDYNPNSIYDCRCGRRCEGRSIRPVFQTEEDEIASSTDENGHVFVDLGLGVDWAACNIGASSPEEYGEYYAWGETTTKTSYTWYNYKFGWADIGKHGPCKYYKDTVFDRDHKDYLKKEDDVASVKWGDDWFMPHERDIEQLMEKCTWTWTSQNGVYGFKVTSKLNGNYIFLPAAGHYQSDYNCGEGEDGIYWSRQYTYAVNANHCARILRFNSNGVITNGPEMSNERCWGCPVRPVRNAKIQW